MTRQFKQGDKLRVIEAHAKLPLGKIVTAASDVRGGDMIDVEVDGNTNNYRGFYISRFELVEEPKPQVGPFKAGDKVRCINKSNYGRIEKDGEYVVESVGGSRGQFLTFVNNDYDSYEVANFELADLNAGPKLKLPLAITRGSGTKVVIMAGSKEGYVTMVYPEVGRTLTNEYTVEAALRKLNEGVWEVTGTVANADLTNAVNQAKIGLEAAKAALAKAEAALATAEADLTNNKPYLA